MKFLLLALLLPSSFVIANECHESALPAIQKEIADYSANFLKDYEEQPQMEFSLRTVHVGDYTSKKGKIKWAKRKTETVELTVTVLNGNWIEEFGYYLTFNRLGCELVNKQFFTID
jgi:hypothetical protein